MTSHGSKCRIKTKKCLFKDEKVPFCKCKSATFIVQKWHIENG